MPAAPANLERALNFRLDGDLHERLARAARDHCRSLNGEILWRLRISFDPRLSVDQQESCVA